MTIQLDSLFSKIYAPMQSQPVYVQVLGDILLFCLFAALAHLVVSQIVRLAKLGAQRTKNPWDLNAVLAARKPLILLVWGMALTTLCLQFAVIFEWDGLWVVERARRVLVLVALSWFVMSFIRRGEEALINNTELKQLDATTATAIGKSLRALIVVVCLMLILQVLEYNISSLLAVGGIGGIAVSFAAKDVLANVFGGLMIYLDRPFAIGDWIRSPDRQIEGVVEHIGWRRTVIRTFERRPLYVPNAIFNTIAVENPSRMSNRRIYETIGVRYADSKICEQIVSEVKAMIFQHEALQTDQVVIVNVNAFADSSIDFFLYCYTKTTDWVEYHAVKQDVLMKVHHIIEASGAEIAFPTQTIALMQESP